MGTEDEKFELVIEFTRADCPRKKTAFCDHLVSDVMLPIPAVGDAVYIHWESPVLLLKVERRIISYGQGGKWAHVQAFCREIEEADI